MKNLKTILAIIGLLIIGFISGFYTHRFMAIQKINKVSEMRFARGFQDNLFHLIDATEEQKEQIKPIVEAYAKKIAGVHRESRTKRKALVDSLHSEMDPFLTDEQKSQLKTFARRFRDRDPGPNRRKGEKFRSRREKKEQ